MVHVKWSIDTNYSTATLFLLKHSSYSIMSVKRPLGRQDKNVYSQINHTLQW